ncbi:hypothetical protein EWM64_g5822 [Hericium alpestre]|uniref:F-box domain-containing protein n=1 Tax=Hericium alpestre TaxID=135208 RepID=A0A4Y9ZVU9_9AGAM|nr:hypothetical protein EWM64_g5822 [Hericium alpestre]
MSLPAELIANVIELVYHLSDGKPDVRTLAACSIVCKNWSNAVRPLLHRHLIIGDVISQGRMWHHHTFDRANALLHAPGNLGTYVRAVHLRVFPLNSSFMEFFTILSFCPHVYQLSLEVTLRAFSELGLGMLASLPVRIRGLELACGPTSPALYQLLQIWPSIQFLDLLTELTAPPPENRPPFTLYELTTERQSLDVLRWLLPPLQDGLHKTDLQILGFWNTPSEDVSDVITEYAPHVRSLRLPHPPKHDFLKPFTALEEFALRIFPGFFPPLPLPQTIQHLRIHNPIVITGPLESRMIGAVEALPNLRWVTVNQPAADRCEFGELGRVCEERGIEMVVDPAAVSLVGHLLFLRGGCDSMICSLNILFALNVFRVCTRWRISVACIRHPMVDFRPR